ncbi:Coproporphyrinogen III oxidase [Dichomitus squalens LYAD-421 SS1]|uniref:coproporphyrinogen oxidase n=1 Tax=Dichomitus squalens (strain LYAD-421) TaxID=732165 RepID=R7SSD7_DICSQ|nr:Coproporphyrinogen III oxidase [Dichomitus squalens LYAD-421 SS1]EJF57897.1 Coproporphyrinogen III oxidase [Dichomitus squalens LYAD-421 SS1]
MHMCADSPSIPDVQSAVPFFEAGLSLFIHPRSPHVPTVHANYRCFEITTQPTEEEAARARQARKAHPVMVRGQHRLDPVVPPHKRFAGDDVARQRTAETFAFVPSYVSILERRYKAASTEHEKRWQLIRRGQYVEFDLVFDRGTKFGLMPSGARRVSS